MSPTPPSPDQNRAKSITEPNPPEFPVLRDLYRTALAFAPCLLVACSQSEPQTETTVPREPAPQGVLAEQRIGDLIAAFTPPEATTTSAVQDDWLRRRRATMARMKRGDEELGALLVEAFLTRKDLSVPVRSGLLEAASYANPKAATPTLIQIVENYGEDIGLRTDACRFLGASAPEAGIETLGKILFESDRAATGPGDEALLDGWLEAHRQLDRDPGRDLADLATEIGRDEATRHLAIRALGQYPSKLSASALEEVLFESSGNSYMRRLAAQSMIEISEREDFCPIFIRLFEREADVNFQLFLESTINEYCQ